MEPMVCVPSPRSQNPAATAAAERTHDHLALAIGAKLHAQLQPELERVPDRGAGALRVAEALVDLVAVAACSRVEAAHAEEPLPLQRVLPRMRAVRRRPMFTSPNSRYASTPTAGNAAANTLSAEQIAMQLRLALLKHLPEIIRESVKPMENIDGIKIIQGKDGGIVVPDPLFVKTGQTATIEGRKAYEVVLADIRLADGEVLVQGRHLGRHDAAGRVLGVLLERLDLGGRDIGQVRQDDQRFAGRGRQVPGKVAAPSSAGGIQKRGSTIK